MDQKNNNSRNIFWYDSIYHISAVKFKILENIDESWRERSCSFLQVNYCASQDQVNRQQDYGSRTAEKIRRTSLGPVRVRLLFF